MAKNKICYEVYIVFYDAKTQTERIVSSFLFLSKKEVYKFIERYCQVYNNFKIKYNEDGIVTGAYNIVPKKGTYYLLYRDREILENIDELSW